MLGSTFFLRVYILWVDKPSQDEDSSVCLQCLPFSSNYLENENKVKDLLTDWWLVRKDELHALDSGQCHMAKKVRKNKQYVHVL